MNPHSDKPHLWEQYDREVWDERFRPVDRRNSRAKAVGDLVSDALGKSILGEDFRLADLSGGIRGSAKESADRFWSGDKDRAALLEAGYAAIEKGQPRCESPIEKHILPFIVFYNWIFAKNVITPVENDEKAESQVFVICQAPVLNYRIDFLICRRFNGQLHRVALECDGAAYHGGKADRKRDLDLLHERIFTIRASGREIYERPGLPIARVEEAFLKLEGCK